MATKVTASKGTTTKTTTTTKAPSTTTFMAPQRPSHHEIALRAYTIWLGKGCPSGHDNDDWFEAEKQLLQNTKTTHR